MCRKFKETSLNILKGIAGINCADEDAIEKAKALPIGTEKTYGGKLYVKTEKGWRLKAKGSSTKKDEGKKESEKEELDEDGELVTVTHDKDKFERYRLFRDLYAARMKRGTSPKLAKEGYLKNSGDVNKKGNEKYYELLKEFGDKKYTYSEKQPKKNKFAREIEEARKIGEQLRKEHEQRVASGQKIGSDDPRDRSKLIGFNKK